MKSRRLKFLISMAIAAAVAFAELARAQNPVPLIKQPLPSFGAEKETLSVIPGQVTVPLNQTVAFIAVFPPRLGKSLASRRVIWHAYNLTKRQSGSISSVGVFTASVAGEYQITAKAGEAEGHASIHVLPGVAATADKAPLRVFQVSSRTMGGESIGNPQQAPITGRVWRDDNFRMAFQIRNRRGHDPLRRNLKNRPLRSVDAGVGDRNFLLTVPVIELAGRGLDVSLNLFYNSNLWLKTQEDEGEAGNRVLITHMIFDSDRGWPAPGWSLGFGKIVPMGSSGSFALQDSDGTLHPFDGQVHTVGNHSNLQAHTTDGSLLDYLVDSSGNGSVQYPNGTTVVYGAYNGINKYPIRIIDANGNFITVAYVNNQGPAIQTIQDTLGRVVNFDYDSSNRLIAVTAPGLNGSTRTAVRFHYSSAGLAKFCCAVRTDFEDVGTGAANNEVNQIDGIYLPGTATGYWFGDTDSYSYYGMIAKVSERRGMTLQASSLNDQGTLSPGTVTRDRVYNYYLQRTALKDAPTYNTMTESWAGMTVPPAVTHYSVQLDADPRRIDTVYPDGTQVTQLMYNHPGRFDDNLLFQTTTRDTSGKLLRQVSTTWEQGDYSSPRVSAVQVTDELSQTVTTQYSYQSPTNSLSEVRRLDYDGTTVPRRTHTDYETEQAYTNRHIFNLPQAISLYGVDGLLASLTEYSYDHQPLSNSPFVLGHADEANPFADVYDPQTDYRGNVTQITRHIDETGSTIELRRYDITGNLVTRSGSCCEQTNISYSLDTQYAYPSSITRGAPDPASPLRLTESFTYDFDTGFKLSSTDPNGRITIMAYEDTTLRPKQVILPTSAFVDYNYDDVGMSATQTVFTPKDPRVCRLLHDLPCKPSVAGQTRTSFNGLGLVQGTATLTDGNFFDAMAVKYDGLGRVSLRSQPYQVDQPTFPPPKIPPLRWTVFSYDSLGRVISLQNPNGSQTTFSYNETSRPGSASKSQGQTLRVVPPYGGDQWYRRNALGQLVEVVEPPAYSGGSQGTVFMDGSVDTNYTYNALGLLTKVVRGPASQGRVFRYDLLGRLTAEFLPEKAATLNDAGTYVEPLRCIRGSCGANWSDTFTYDDRSNLTSHTDARGIKTIYDYFSDPLDRLQALNYEFVAGTRDDGSILASPPVAYKYMSNGDVTRLFQVALSRGNDSYWIVKEYVYDTQARVASNRLQHRNQPVLEVDYKYDALNRLVEETYPAEFGIPAQPRKKLDYSYGIGGQLQNFQVDGADYASQLTYNPGGQATSITIGPTGPQQTVEAYAYDPATALLSSQQLLRGSSGLLTIAYNYYPNGQLKQLLEGGGNREFDYVYDTLGRLWSLRKAAGSDGPEWSESYSFDLYGNRTGVAASGQVNGVILPTDGLPSLSYDTNTNHVTTAGFTYDAAGNQTRAQRADGSWLKYQYDQSGRLAKVTDDGGKLLESYVYGADGKRLVTTDANGNTYYFWDQNRVIAEYSQPSSQLHWTWSEVRTYLGDRLLATFVPLTSGEAVFYHHPDRLGTRVITNAADTNAVEQTTLPFGTLIPNASSSPFNPVFTSYERSSITGLDYAINRQYDPQQRFVQSDPAEMAAVNLSGPQSLNLYSYLGNDPVNGTDPVGLDQVRECTDLGDGTSLCTGGLGGSDVGAIVDNSTGQQVGDPFLVAPDITVTPDPSTSGSNSGIAFPLPAESSGSPGQGSEGGYGGGVAYEKSGPPIKGFGLGCSVGGTAELGIGKGFGATGSIGYGMFFDFSNGWLPYISFGGFASGGATWLSLTSPRSGLGDTTGLPTMSRDTDPGDLRAILGAYLGQSTGMWVASAQNVRQLQGVSQTTSLNLPAASAQVSSSPLVLSMGYGPGAIGSLSSYPTKTCTWIP